jgi:uncharacterized protein with PQ loop repeat
VVQLHAVSALLGWLAVAVGVLSTYVQFRRVSLEGTAGVSATTWMLFVYMGFFWILWGLSTHSWQVVLSSTLIMPLQLRLVFWLRPWDDVTAASRALAFFALCCVAPTLLWGWAAGIYGTGVAMSLNRGPQIVGLLASPDASGVSVGSWATAVAGSLLWVGYYFGTHRWAALVATGFAGLANLSVAVLAGWRHQQGRQGDGCVELAAAAGSG